MFTQTHTPNTHTRISAVESENEAEKYHVLQTEQAPGVTDVCGDCCVQHKTVPRANRKCSTTSAMEDKDLLLI